jgi:integrase
MQWSEIDEDKAVWVIPAKWSKNGRDHLVPLSETVLQLVTSLCPTKAARTGPVFSTDGIKPINGFSKPKAKLDIAVAKVLAKDSPAELPMMQPWVFHDLRRTFQTNAQALGFPRDHIHAAVNHAAEGRRSGLARIYQLYEYQSEKTALMGAWSRKVAQLVTGSGAVDNVIELRAGLTGGGKC